MLRTEVFDRVGIGKDQIFSL